MEKMFKILWSFTWFKVLVIVTLLLQSIWLMLDFVPELNLIFFGILYTVVLLIGVYKLEKEEANPNSPINHFDIDEEDDEIDE